MPWYLKTRHHDEGSIHFQPNKINSRISHLLLSHCGSLMHFWGHPHDNQGNLNSSTSQILLDSINLSKHKLFNRHLKTSVPTSQKTEPQLHALLPRAVNSDYAKPVTICELNEAFFREMAHMVTI
jgi:hypothetical protein